MTAFATKPRIRQSVKGVIRSAQETSKQLLRCSKIPTRWCGPAKDVALLATEAVEQMLTRGQEASIVEVDAPRLVRRVPPRTIDATLYWQFSGLLEESVPGSFVVKFAPGQVLGSEATILTADGNLVWEACKEVHRPASTHRGLTRILYTKPRMLRGTTAVLAVVGGENYFHFLLEAIPRLGIFRRAGLPGADRFIINQLAFRRVQRDVLAAVCPAAARWVVSHAQANLFCERLLVPSARARSGVVPKEAFEFVRATFLPQANSVTDHLPRRFFVDRKGASYRRIVNSGEVELTLSQRGIVPVRLEEMSFAEQVALFSRAELIVAPHGAGLTNLVFCQPGCQCLELFAPGYVNPVFWTIACMAKVVYGYLLGCGQLAPEGVDPHGVGDSIEVPLASLIDALEMLK